MPNERRRFSRRERTALYLAADGKCTECGRRLDPGWHADHIQPHSRHGATDVINGQALCPDCNLKKGNKMSRELLDWQQETLDKYRRAVNPARFLIAAFPGMGKTKAAAAILEQTDRFGIILVPQADCLTSWRATLHEHSICPASTVAGDGISGMCSTCVKPVRAAVMTYDLAAANPHIIATIYRKYGPCLLICDEVHHLRHERAWSAAIIAAQPYIDTVLSLSATPFRTDEEPVPFVHTEGPWTREISILADDLIAEYGYGKALTMKPPPVARAVFERYDADVTWLESDIDGEVERTATLSGQNNLEVARKARRHAVDTRGHWLSNVLHDADSRLLEIRNDNPRAGGVIVCRDINHAVATADFLVRETDGDVTVYTQEYATPCHRIGNGRRDNDGRRKGHRSGDILGDYKDGNTKWVVTVRKVSEGVDIPRLQVLVYATVTRTRLFFVQVVGRVIRIVWGLAEHVDQTAWVYIPDDEDMRVFAAEVENDQADAEITIAEQDDDEDDEKRRQDRERSEATDRFISAEPEYAGAIFGGNAHDPQLAALAREFKIPHDTVRKLYERGVLNLSGTASSASPKPPTDFDPVAHLAKKTKDKDNAVKSWAALRVRTREFPNFGEAARACNRELGEQFNVWKSNKDVNIAQIEKATQHAREQIKMMRRD